MMRAIILGCVLLAGCDTMGGLGMDMQRAGQNLSDRAQESKGPPPAPPPYAPVHTPSYELDEE